MGDGVGELDEPLWVFVPAVMGLVALNWITAEGVGEFDRRFSIGTR